jgi:hypothetical protein
MLQGEDGNCKFIETLESLQHSTLIIQKSEVMRTSKPVAERISKTFRDKTRQFATYLAST